MNPSRTRSTKMFEMVNRRPVAVTRPPYANSAMTTSGSAA
jgi:hypothetical protein